MGKRRTSNKGGRPALGPGRGRDGVFVRMRVDRREKETVAAYCRRHGLTEAELLREALERAGVLKPRTSIEIDPELRHPPAVES